MPRDNFQRGAHNSKRYWCEACGDWRMSGGKATVRARSFDFMLGLADDINRLGVTVTLPPDPPAHVLALMKTLGVDVKSDPRLERPATWRRAA